MPNFITVVAFSGILAFIGQSAVSGQFVVELSEPLGLPSKDLMQAHGVVLNDSLASGSESYAIFTATDQSSLMAFLTASLVDAEKVSEVLFVNSPALGGGTASGASPRAKALARHCSAAPGRSGCAIAPPLPKACSAVGAPGSGAGAVRAHQPAGGSFWLRHVAAGG